MLATLAACGALAGCVVPPDPGPASAGPRALLRGDAPVLVALEGLPVAEPSPAAATAQALVVAGPPVRARAVPLTLGLGMLSMPLALLGGLDAAGDCDARAAGLQDVVAALRAALPGAQGGFVRAFDAEVGADVAPGRPDPGVSLVADDDAAIAEARASGHPLVLGIGPIVLAPSGGATAGGCHPALEASVVMRAIRTADGEVRWRVVRRLPVADAVDAGALRAWAADPSRVGEALRALGERIAIDVRWLL
ncbi:MAG: hypothetical protein RJA99_2627 [Pseudomonadota bacterium]|jgi:hypothetical protein